MKGESFGFTPFCRYDVDSHVSASIAGEGDPFSIGGKMRVRLHRGCTGESQHILPVQVGHPEVRSIGEGHLGGAYGGLP